MSRRKSHNQEVEEKNVEKQTAEKQPEEKKPEEKKPEEKKPDEKKPDEKKPVAYVYVGNKNRLELEIGEGEDKRILVLWRNMVYRNLPECKEVEELIEKGEIKPIYA
jgi:hypothetical protein